ncbi:TetR/AcrR family transcriptional regulator [Nocardia transvalensis]|uniref:TetR/AcrR family transcriptional regulator n=1 Tax=Nocardia transvalensis TaxID=37333 RepID=UPI002B4B8A06|nr:TetR/AcrR family transcriptional regulator [Nocardia transvalensis]
MAAPKNAPTDPARTIALLWGLHPKPGRKGLTVAAIVAAGIELADAEGLDAVTMRRVAERLGVGAMSLYTHVPGKTDLIDLMQDAVLSGLYRDIDEPATAAGGWRAAMTLIATRNWELYRAHPWLLDLVGTRPVPGPHTTAKYEAELRALEGLGLTDVEMDSVLALVLTHVQGTARLSAGSEATAGATHLTDPQWWDIAAPILARLVDPKKFPVASRVGTAAGIEHNAATSPAHVLTFGLDRILDGIADLIDQRRGETPAATSSNGP